MEITCLEFRQLKYFCEVARLAHFSKAAQNLFISQSALSQQIRILEEELGVNLFDPEKRLKMRKVELTAEGKSFYKDALEIIKLADEAVKNVQNKGKTAVLRIGFFKLAFRESILEIIQRIKSRVEGSEIRIEEFSTIEGVQNGLLEGKIDLGMTLLPLKDKQLQARVYQKDYLSVIVSRDHPLSDSDIIHLDQLKDEKWVIINKPLHPYFDYIEGLCKKAGFSRQENIVQEVSSHEMLCSLVSLNIGIAFMPNLYDLQNEPNIVSCKVLMPGSENSIEVNHAVAWRTGEKSPVLKRIQQLF